MTYDKSRPLERIGTWGWCGILFLSLLLVAQSSHALVSDDFNASTLDTGIWTVVDPLGDATIALTGTQLAITVPEGTAHDVWTSGNFVPQVQQAVDDTDFEVSVKFESPVTERFQHQGLLIQADSANLVRAEVYSDGTSTKLFAATLTGGVAYSRFSQSISIGTPHYLRVTREGDQWTIAYSSDGASWTFGGSFEYALAVSTVGVHAGNAFGKVAHTALVDYVFNTASPIDPEDGGGGDTTPPVISNVQIDAGETSATLSWTSDEAATSEVSYGPTSAYESGSVVSESTFVTAHSVTLSGLTAGTLYHYQVTAVDAAGNVASAADATFTTTGGGGGDTTPPVISNVQIDAGETSATLSWTSDEAATSEVSYGPTSAYEAGTVVSESTFVTAHSVTLSGLTAGTLYHYQVTAVDAAGNVASAADATFTTTSGGTPPSEFVSDDFSSAALDTGIWTVVDPLGDATIALTGTQLAITVPEGTAHDVWTSGNFVPQVQQAVDDTDFEVSVKFESPVTERFQHQGLLIQADSANLVRAEVYSDGTSTKLFAATLTGGVAYSRFSQSISIGTPHYLRVTREGDQWTIAYSSDGASWTFGGSFEYALAVSTVGVHAGNAFGKVAHTALVDYVFNTASPIDPEDGGGGDTTPPVISNVQIDAGETSATLSWTSDEAATSEVSYGPTSAYESGSVVSESTFVTAHSVTLSGLTAGTLYHYQVTAVDAAGNVASAADATFTTTGGGGGDTTPPVISNVQIDAGETSATLSWTSDEAATSEVSYGPTSAYEAGTVVSESTFVTAHSVTLSGLTAGTLYHYQVTAVDAAGNVASAADATFTTTSGGTPPSEFVSDDFSSAALDTGIWTVVDPLGDATIALTGTQLAITVPEGTAHDVWTSGNFVPQVQQAVDDTDFEVSVKFESPVTERFQHQGLLIQADSANLVRAEVYSDGTSTKLFAATLTGGVAYSRFSQSISIGTPHYLRVTREGDQWTIAYSSDGASWTFGGSFEYALAVSTVGVHAGNAFGKVAHTALVDYVFNTASPIDPEDGGGGDTTPPVISNVQIDAGETSATLSWTSDEAATSEVSYGPTSAYESGSVVSESTFVTAHSVTLSGLTAGTLYHYQVTAVDAAGNVASAADATFTTTGGGGGDTTPPVISNVQIDAGETSATLSWTSDEAATSEVSYGPTSAYEAGTVVSESTFVTAHSVTLSGLTAGTLYHYQVTAVDAAGNVASAADATFTTTSGGTPPSEFVSDDFSSAALDTGIWTVVDPLGDATIALTGTQLAITVPEGTAHDVWTSGNFVPQVQQAVDDTDFEVSVKFESPVTERFQHQGLLIQADSANLVRAEVYSDGTSTKLFAATLTGGVAYSRFSQSISIGTPHYLRVTREGDQWTIAYSSDGASWTFGGSFEYALAVSTVGVHAGNAFGKVAHTALVDYVFNTASPIDPEDGGGGDTTPPVISNVQIDAGETSATLSWTSDEAATSEVSYGPTSAYESGSVVSESTFVTAHSVTLSGLTAGTLYHYQVTAVDAAGNVASAADATFTTTGGGGGDTTPPVISNVQIDAGETSATLSWTSDEAATSEVSYGPTSAYESGSVVSESTFVTAHSVTLSGLTAGTLYHYQVTAVDAAGNVASAADATFTTTSGGGGTTPVIDVWYGSNQKFGNVGIPQQWVNILGNVYDPDGISTLSYSLNGGSDQPLSIGPDKKRLAEVGDFVVEIDYLDLFEGMNQVAITATDTFGYTTVTNVDIEFNGTLTWPLPYSIDWDSVTNIQDVIQIVDGQWALVPDGIRNVQIDYDRLLAFGDLQWDYYEITIPITLHSVDTRTGYLVGMILRWAGHTDSPIYCPQPHCGWSPNGIFTYWGKGDVLKMASEIYPDFVLELGVRYNWKVRVQEMSGTNLYALKVWEDGMSEPQNWDLYKLKSGGLTRGSVLLIAHNVEATFGDLEAIPLDNNNPLLIDNVEVNAGADSAEITWSTNLPASSSISYGLDGSYLEGRVTGETLQTSHAMTIYGLSPGTTYHFQLSSVAENGETGLSSDSVFVTLEE